MLQEDTRFIEYYLKFAVEYVGIDDSDLEISPRSLQRDYLHTNLTTIRAILQKFPEESYSRALRGYLIFTLQISIQKLLSTTRDRYGNIRLQYIGLLYHPPAQVSNIFHQSTFIMKGVMLELREAAGSDDCCNLCHCLECRFNRILTIATPADRVYSIFEYKITDN